MIFDIEGDGLKPTKIHVMAYTTSEGIQYTHDYDEMRKVLKKAKTLIGHNIIRFDIPVLERILGVEIKAKLIDTLALSWYIYPNRVIHGLDSFGQEFGVPKPKIDDWENLSQEEYAHRCVEDVKINKRLWNNIKDKLLMLYGDYNSANRLISYLSFKMDCLREQEENQWKLDVELAQNTLEELEALEQSKLSELIVAMPEVPVIAKRSKPKAPFKKDGTWSAAGARWFNLLKRKGLPEDYEGEVEEVVRYTEPNPGSPHQVKEWLFSLGWEPETFDFKRNEDGSERRIPQVRVDLGNGKELCPSVLKLAEDKPEVEILEGLTIIQHRLAIFRGFLSNQEDGYLFADAAGFTNTLRLKHRILVNLPGVSKAYGEQIRGSLVAREGKILCGSDMVSLEDTTKRHYMWDYDPDYVTEMSREGFDPHLDLAKFAKVVTQEQIDMFNEGIEEVVKKLKPIRKNYKVTNYSATYGVRPPKLSRTAGITMKEAERLLDAFWERNWSLIKIAENTEVKHLGDEMWLLNPVSKLYYSLRHDKDRFSTLNQGTGVFCFDSWIREWRSARPSKDVARLLGQFHDEVIIEIDEGKEKPCRKMLTEAIERVNKKLKLNIQLGVDVQFGHRYSDIH